MGILIGITHYVNFRIFSATQILHEINQFLVILEPQKL